MGYIIYMIYMSAKRWGKLHRGRRGWWRKRFYCATSSHLIYMRVLVFICCANELHFSGHQFPLENLIILSKKTIYMAIYAEKLCFYISCWCL